MYANTQDHMTPAPTDRYRTSRRRGLSLLLATVAACSDGVEIPETGTLPDGPRPTPYALTTTKVRVNGVSRLLVIPAQFFDGAAPPITSSNLRASLFGDGKGGGPIAKTYTVASEGKFLLYGDVAEWVKTQISHTNLGTPGTVASTGEGDYVIQAIDLADPTTDFTLYDSDGPDGIANSGDDDGLVDGGIVVMHSDADLMCNGGTGLGPHPHATNAFGTGPSRAPYRTKDVGRNGVSIGIKAYTILSAVDCPNTGGNKSVLAHELGHTLFGLPDLYHIVETRPPAELWMGRRWVVGCWDLMSAGSWGCGAAEPPYFGTMSTIGAPGRVTIGWTTPQEVPITTVTTYTLTAIGRGGGALKVPIVPPGEYLLIEYRQSIDGDLRIPGAGVLIYHVNQGLPLVPAPTAVRRYRFDLIEADDDSSLVRAHDEGGNRGVASDAFGPTVTSLTSTHSEARSTSGQPFPFVIDNISINQTSGTAQLRISPVTSAAVAANSLTRP